MVGFGGQRGFGLGLSVGLGERVGLWKRGLIVKAAQQAILEREHLWNAEQGFFPEFVF